MCGIVGYVGQDNATEILIDGLKRLEYRGYDSAGIALLKNNTLDVIKETGRVAKLNAAVLAHDHKDVHLGISHTRWATHGSVTRANAHPHVSSDGKFALVHNGVIENYASIKKFLIKKGYTFKSETDTEAIVNLIAYHYEKEPKVAGKNRFLDSFRKSLFHLEGTYGLAVICKDYPNEMVGVRKSSPLIVGVGKGEHLLASDVTAIATRTSQVVYLKDNEIVHLTADGFSLQTINESEVQAVIEKVHWEIKDAELGDYKHYMEKEIFEQPEALENAMRGRFSDDHSTALFGGFNLTPHELRQVDRIVFCGCGTARHACLVGEYLIERYARIPVEVEHASEFRYRNAPLDKNTIVFVISQSGETIDTLEALRESQRKGFKTLAITNVVGSSIAREADGGIYQHAGPEIGVASTKAFTSQLLIVALMALYMGRMRDLNYDDGLSLVEAFRKVPEYVRKTLDQADHIRQIAHKYAHYKDMLFLGRQYMYPIALEGALKLKEISYVHAEGYPAAEMKHGPIALISPECPSVFLAPFNSVYQKTLANMQEVKARKGPIIAIVSEGADFPKEYADEIIEVPHAHEAVKPIISTIPVQLLSYYIALERGCDVDKPRNLAKSVTVE